MKPKMKDERLVQERSLTDAEKEKKEEIVKSMKKKYESFQDRYGDRAKSVMYATATKLAKREGFEYDFIEEDFIAEAMGTYSVAVMKMMRGKEQQTRIKVRANSESEAIAKAKKTNKITDAWEAIEVDTPLPSQKNKKPSNYGAGVGVAQANPGGWRSGRNHK